MGADVLRVLVVGIMLATGYSTSASAFLFCSEPTKPSCIDRYGTFDDELSFDRCKSEVESYLRNAQSYRSCLIDQVNNTKSEANAVVDKFNFKAKGGIVCR